MPDIGDLGPYTSGQRDVIPGRFPDPPTALLALVNHVGPAPGAAGVVWDQPLWDMGALWGPAGPWAGQGMTWDYTNWNDGSVWNPVPPPHYPYPPAVQLPQAQPFQALELEILNRGNEALIVYPPEGGQIEAYGIDIGVEIGPGVSIRCYGFGPPQGPLGGAQWYVANQSAIALPFVWLQDDLGNYITDDQAIRIPLT